MKDKKDTINKILRCVIFAVICCACLLTAQNVLNDKESKDYQKMHAIFKEPENSFDAIFLGSSSTYAYWNPAVAWNEKGIAVYSMSNASQPFEITHYLIDDIKDRHPNALYIINITRMLEVEKYYDAKIFRYVNAYPFTANKYIALNHMLNITNVPLKDRLQYFLPIIRFHSRWKELKAFDLSFTEEPYKSASRYANYLKTTKAQKPVDYDFEVLGELTETMTATLDNIMNYCKEEELKVLFVFMPQALHREVSNNRQNTVAKTLVDNGFDILDLRKVTDEIGLDFSKHYYDNKHTNIHGSILVTEYISNYLIENYDFKDKRGTEEYADWDKECKAYYKHIAKHLWDEDYKYLSLEKPAKK